MPGLVRGVARTAVVAGTATAVSNRVSRRQAGRWSDQDQQSQQAQADAYAQQQYAQQQYAAQQAYQAPPPPAPVAAPIDMDEKIQQLTQLASLKDQGILTEAEFQQQKAKLLA